MNAKLITASVMGVLLLLTVVMIREPAVPFAPAVQGAADNGGRATAPRRAGNDQDTATAGEIHAHLLARVETLEQQIQFLNQTRELDELRSRVTQLERAMRDGRQATSDSRRQAGSIDQLQREHASLKRAHDQLASKVARAENRTSPAVNDLRVLQQKVFSLETAVQRLQSR